jgi:hypothetical protein
MLPKLKMQFDRSVNERDLGSDTTDRVPAIPRRRALTLKTVRLCRLQALSVRVSQPQRNFFLDIETRFFADVL